MNAEAFIPHKKMILSPISDFPLFLEYFPIFSLNATVPIYFGKIIIHYFPTTCLKFTHWFRRSFVFLRTLRVFRFLPIDHDAFMHHTIHVLDSLYERIIAGYYRSLISARQPQGATSRPTGNYEWRTFPRSLHGG